MLKSLLSSGAVIAFVPIGTPALAQNIPNAQAPTAQAQGRADISQASAANRQQVRSGAIPSPDQTGIAEIVVTAERREQSLQRAPLTIQVVQGADLAKAGVTDTLGLQRVTTGVQIGANGANTQVFVRGVGSFSAGLLTSPGVAFNVDGVYVNQTFGTNGNFYDLARVEVLKGPQGTLYGRNATGGAINLITNAPVFEKTTMDLSLEGGNYQYVRATGAVNLPIGDTAAVRGAFNVVNRKGYLSDGQDDDIEQSGRVRFKWQADPNVTIQLSGDYSHFGGQGGDYVYLPRRPGASPYESQTTSAANAYAASFGPAGPLLLPARPDIQQNTSLYNVSGQLDWKLPFATLTLLPAYRHMDVDFGVHFNTRLQTSAGVDQTTMEARLGNSSKALTWVIGGYYFHENLDSLTQIRTTLPFVDLVNSDTVADPRSTSYAAFGQATLSLTSHLRAIGGIRYTHEHKTVFDQSTDASTGIPGTGVSGAQNFSNVSFKAGGEFDLGPRSLLYATYSTGYKSGGFSQGVSPTFTAITFGPERLRAVEVGSKNRFFDNRLQVNVSGFYWKYRSIQDSRPAFDGAGNLNLITFNSGNATLYGASVDIVARVTRHDAVSLSGEYTHARYDSFAYTTPAPLFNPASTGCRVSGPFGPGATLPGMAGGSDTNTSFVPVFYNNCAGFQVARVPKFSANADLAHDFDLQSGAKITLDANVNYSRARGLTSVYIPAARDGGYAIVNADLSFTTPDDRLSVGLFVRNLTKTVYYTGAIESGVQAGLVAANIGAPRTFGARLTYKFGS